MRGLELDITNFIRLSPETKTVIVISNVTRREVLHDGDTGMESRPLPLPHLLFMMDASMEDVYSPLDGGDSLHTCRTRNLLCSFGLAPSLRPLLSFPPLLSSFTPVCFLKQVF